MKQITRSALVGCSAEEFYALVEDIEAYPRFLPWCAAAQVRERTPGATVATLTLAAKGLRHSFTTANSNEPGRGIDMRLVEGPFRHFHAQWRFSPLSDQACKAEFTLEYEFAGRIVAGLLEPIFARLADKTLDAFRQRAESGARA
jgi:ribosome-associated toxin RatA of RatAB toxin-antitoxin module